MTVRACAAPAGEPVAIPRSQDIELVSRESGAPYRVMLWRPAAEPPPEGYPVVYLLDGNAMFGMVTDIVNTRSRDPGAGGMRPAVVVGLGYPSEEPYDARRAFDYTPRLEGLSWPPRPNGEPWPPTGGAEAFLRLLETQVKPLAAERLPLDRTAETLLGHSFGGLFALHAMLARPAAFATYVAGSPSIWFDTAGLLERARSFEPAPGDTPRRLFVAVGGLEGAADDAEAERRGDEEQLASTKGGRMIGNARDFVAALPKRQGLAVSFEVVPDEGHSSVVPAFLSRGLHAALAG